jgi:glycosyltransferase involved in cell wall biosynthesis
MKIFIQVASYRDPQLIPTIKSALENAKHPENLVFGIARQYHPDDKFDDLSEYENDDRFRILNILYSDAKGACWARNQIQQLYGGEEYTLQIDSHMRFAPNWDEEMINMVLDLQEKGYEKPLLTGYVSSFDPDNDPQARIQEPWRMVFDRFIPEGAVFFLPETIPGWQKLTEPVTARFYSAHYCFTLGQFAQEVQHDPDYYFHGEEISIAARAYTWGYDLFHPHKVLIWHEYTRKGRTKQWDDDKKWVDRNNLCHKKNRALFGMDNEEPMDFGIYGFGSKRTLKDYEKYSGLLFSRRAIQQETIDKKYPPNTYNYETEEEWINSFASIFKHCIDIGYDQVPENDYDFWAVAFHDENDETIYRRDADPDEINRMKNDPDGYCKVWREFQTTIKPKYWVVWPYSKSKGWADRITGNLY